MTADHLLLLALYVFVLHDYKDRKGLKETIIEFSILMVSCAIVFFIKKYLLIWEV